MKNRIPRAWGWHIPMFNRQLCRLRKTIVMQVNIISFLLLLGCLQLSATTLSQTVSLKAENLPLNRVFSEIEAQTGYYVMYNSRYIQSAKPVTISATRMPVDEFRSEANTSEL